MRAKTVNEDQHFERGKNPKTALGLGGIVLEKELGYRIEETEKEISLVAKAASEEYSEWLRKTFVGKTITAEMHHLPGVNTKTNQSVKSKGSGEFTFKVQDILPGDSITDMLKRGPKDSFTLPVENQTIIVADMENNVYQIKIRNKIYIEE